MKVVITDQAVEKLWTKDFDCPIIAFPPGEKFKTRATKEWIEDELIRLKCGRDTTLIALGGGVVLDIAGFVAATFMRGIPYISIPTTLLAMVDASIGGKTGVNTPLGKNLIGAFYPPVETVIDVKYLKTLPVKGWQNGYAEIVKYGLIGNSSLLSETDPISLIEKSREEKRKVIELDPYEKGLRRTLNFGHTIGHALEQLTKYEISHGEAVFFGMKMESRLSYEMGYLSYADLEKVQTIIAKYCPTFSFRIDPKWNWEEAMSCDKKAVLAKPRFVMLKSIGSTHEFGGEYCTHSPLSDLAPFMAL